MAAAAADVLDLGTGGPGPMAVLVLAGLDPSILSEAALIEAVGAIDEQVGWLHSLRAVHLAELARRHADDVVEVPPLAPGEWRDGRETHEAQWERETVGLRCSTTAYEARTRLETAAALEQRLPATARLLAAGGLSWQHAVALAQETSGLDETGAGLVERRVLADGRAVTAGQFRRRARRLVAALLPPTPADELPERSLTSWDAADGVELRVRLTTEGGAVVATCLDALATPTDADDERPVETRRADALVELCRSRLDAGTLPTTAGGTRPHLMLAVPLATLAGADELPATLGYDHLSAVGARRIACDAGVSTLLHTADVVDLGREQRFPTVGLRRRLDVRDGGCRFPTCTRPAPRCHAHHVVHWAAGGPTSEDNLLLLCSRHHHLVHEGGWHLRFDGTTTTWTTPTGADYQGPSPLARPPEPTTEFFAWLPPPTTRTPVDGSLPPRPAPRRAGPPLPDVNGETPPF